MNRLTPTLLAAAAGYVAGAIPSADMAKGAAAGVIGRAWGPSPTGGLPLFALAGSTMSLANFRTATTPA